MSWSRSGSRLWRQICLSTRSKSSFTSFKVLRSRCLVTPPAVIDSPSVKTAEGGVRGPEARKNVTGRKRSSRSIPRG